MLLWMASAGGPVSAIQRERKFMHYASACVISWVSRAREVGAVASKVCWDVISHKQLCDYHRQL